MVAWIRSLFAVRSLELFALEAELAPEDALEFLLCNEALEDWSNWGGCGAWAISVNAFLPMASVVILDIDDGKGSRRER
ncbi:hypothetical protein OGAPHI_003514 [Ogataea philodendri]|uniref:Uncharacterized protein n=1 Tax=Ogataea philodendri TaxID=1378263 RepID=A0A9P8P647_9ASCO|nr:uncharacterized protein OGAPHI_003514 [Ogataea philodendri]KAH3666518.1 hypothetical protein OGAPHI_003514 [Ogataea philodendri]